MYESLPFEIWNFEEKKTQPEQWQTCVLWSPSTLDYCLHGHFHDVTPFLERKKEKKRILPWTERCELKAVVGYFPNKLLFIYFTLLSMCLVIVSQVYFHAATEILLYHGGSYCLLLGLFIISGNKEVRVLLIKCQYKAQLWVYTDIVKEAGNVNGVDTLYGQNIHIFSLWPSEGWHITKMLNLICIGLQNSTEGLLIPFLHSFMYNK